MQVHNYKEILQNTHKNWRKFDVVFYLYTLDRNPTAFDLNWFIFIQSDLFFTYWHQQNEILINGLFENPLLDEVLVHITEFTVFNFYHGKLLVFSPCMRCDSLLGDTNQSIYDCTIIPKANCQTP